MAELPAISGKVLLRLLQLDGWTIQRYVTHGYAVIKRFPDGYTRRTIIPNKSSSLPAGTLAAILGPRQSGLGREGLLVLIERYGL